MRLLTFPCVRAHEQHATECASTSASLLASHEAVREALSCETLVKDGGRAYYLYEGTEKDAQPRCALLGIMRLDEGDECLRALDAKGRAAADAQAAHILESHLQTIPATLTYPENPVLTAIIAAAELGAALFDIYDPAGTRHRVWKIGRTDAIEAIDAMVQQLPEDSLTADAVMLGAMTQARDALRRKAKAAGSHTGREPFNFGLVALLPTSGAAHSKAPRIPEGLIMHQVAPL